jgi:alpha-tubulin suppressor-like RCC1 family protein
MTTKATLLATTILAIALSMPATAENYYFRSKGSPVVSSPPQTPDTATIETASSVVRAVSQISGSLASSFSNPTWSFGQSPASPVIEFSATGDKLSGLAPGVSAPTSFTITAEAQQGGKSASASPVSVVVHPLLAMTGGPVGKLEGFLGRAFPAQPAAVLTGLVQTASYSLLSAGSQEIDIGTRCAGLAFSKTTGQISGSATAVCEVPSLSIQAKDSFDDASIVSGTFSISVTVAPSNVSAWGINTIGQLGDTSTTTRPTPIKLAGGKVYSRVASGNGHGCGIVAADGTVECWGFNNNGQLGRTANGNANTTPMAVPGITGATEIAAGDSHTCAAVPGGVKCWGSNSVGQLGDATTITKSTPVSVSGLGTVSALAAGSYHTCAISSSNLFCWGSNEGRQIGDGTSTNRSTPMQVLAGASAVGGGNDYTCAIASGGVKCWGQNGFGQLGNGSFAAVSTPPSTSILAGASSLTTGRDFTCAVVSGAVKCWGNNANGQLGDGTKGSKFTPTQVSGLLNGATAVAAGGLHACAVVSGKVSCWGYNGYGQIGLGFIGGDVGTPYEVFAVAGATRVAAGGQASFAW